ncbi:MAG: carbohydrate kinase family protein [Spirochaetes bacterium]|nr:carbohydrate kinase family protein [Spirochaetota bacterium]MBU1078855.1 carbohydrate kinase family protein [Spirochaetota bacterium]
MPIASTDTVLLGPLTLDRYVEESLALPGGGALNIAYAWMISGEPFRVVSRIGDDATAAFLGFLERHGIAHDPGTLVVPGLTASIDIRVLADGQTVMDNYSPGVWAGLRLSGAEDEAIAGARGLHAMLVEPVIREVHRLGEAGYLAGLESSGDFLDYRYYDAARFRDTMRFLRAAFVGWAGAPDDPAVEGMREVAFDLGRLVVVTLGERGVLAFDGAARRQLFVPVEAVPIAGSSVGCGDAFTAAFLAARRRGADLEAAIERGKTAGARATAWRRALPDEAYEPAPRPAAGARAKEGR